MIAKLQKIETAAARESCASENFSRETPMIAEDADRSVVEQHDASGRRLRNRLMAANAVAWIVIIVLIRLVFF
jgi:hypothetical protein